MNKVTSHLVSFICGAIIASLSVLFFVHKYSTMFIFEHNITDQKVYLGTLKLLRENKVGQAIDMIEINACLYYQLEPNLKHAETEDKTKQYFIHNYPQGNSPCAKVPNLRSNQ